MREKIESIVRKVVTDYFAKNNQKQTNRKILILLENQLSSKQEPVWDAVQSLAKNYETTICSSEKWSNAPEDLKHVKRLPLDSGISQELNEAIEKSDVLFIATATYTTIAKLALTIDDDLAMWIATQMQFNGKKIIVASDHCRQKGSQKITTPYSVSKRIKTYYKQLREDKVELVLLSEVAAWLNSYFEGFTHQRHVVLAKHIEEAVSQGDSELVVPKNSLITPMCKDYARELGVLIKQEE